MHNTAATTTKRSHAEEEKKRAAALRARVDVLRARITQKIGRQFNSVEALRETRSHS